MKRKTAFKFIALTFSLAISVLILEVGIRVAFPFYHPGRQIVFKRNPEYMNAAFGPANETIRQRTPKGDYDLKVTFNRHGLRDDQDLAESSAGAIFTVGDSFTMGWGVEQEERFSDLLSDAVGRPVYNIAIPGDLKSYQGLLAYSRERDASIGFLVVGLCMNNDLKNYFREDKHQPSRFGDRQPWKARLRARLQSSSALYLFLSYELQRNAWTREMFEKLGISRDINELTLQNIYDEDVMKSSMKEMQRIVEPYRGDRHLVLVIPSMALWVGDNREQERRIHETFVSRMKDNGINVLDMLPVLDAKEEPLAFYFETDPHWNAKGHALAAEQLAARYSGMRTGDE